MNYKFSGFLLLFLLLSVTLFTSSGCSKDDGETEQIIEEKNYSKEKIGSYFKFNEEVVLIKLNDSSKDIFFKSHGATFFLTRASLAEFLEKKKNFPLWHSTTFKLIKVFNTIHTNFDHWDEGARDLYLSTKKSSPSIDMYFLLEGNNGIKFITMSGTFRKAELIK